jgi:fibronectin type 3 domain-containing protein
LEALESRPAPANVDVLSYHNDSSLSGQNLQEEVLTPGNVNATNFGNLFNKAVDGYVYAQPLYKANLAIPGQGTHNVAFVATEHDSVYAFDTGNPTAGAGPEGSLWKTSFLDAANGITSVTAEDVGIVHTNIVPEVGITGTPVIDGATNTLYVVAKTKEMRADGAHYVQKLHALDITTGKEKFGGPATIGDTLGTNTNTSTVAVAGGGHGSVNGVVTFNARKELQRPGLQLVNGIVYIAWASHEDDRPYHGWVVGYNARNLAAGPVKVFNTAPNAGGVGVWQSGGAVAADADGNLYFAVGNGFNGPDSAFDPAHGNYSESVLKLSATGQLSVADYFTPYDWQNLDNQDADLGSGGTMLLPNFVGSPAHPHLMLETGKSGKIYLIDRDNRGKINNPPCGPDLVVQTVTAGQAGVWGNPTFFKVNATTGIIYYHGQGDYLKAYSITNAHIDDTVGHILKSNVFSGYPGTQPVVSANGIANPTSPTNGIVWELQVDSATGPAILRAFNATNLATELYDSSQTSLRDLPGGAVKFTVPTVTNGHVLVAQQYTFSVFGLFPPATSAPAPRTNLQGTGQAGTQGPQIQLTWTNPIPVSGAAATGIKVFRSTDNANFSQIATVAASVATYTDQGPLTPGQNYFYKVVATNQVGDSAASNMVEVVAPIAASVLTITSVTSSSLGLNWTAVANDHYDIERSTNGGNFTKVASVPASQTAYTDTGLAPGIYAYRIHAFSTNPNAESLSNVRGATVGGVINHGNGFGNPVDLTANGAAQFAENAARLTGADLQTGSVFANTLLTVTKFSTMFIVRLHEGTQPDYADGFTFVLQANAPTALGQGFGGLGYQGITNSVAVKFGTFQYPSDPSNSSTGLVLNGAAPRGGVTTGSVLLNSQNPKQIDLTYDGTTLTEKMTDTLTNATFMTSYVVNIPQVLGGDLAYVGFTGSTGSPGPKSFWELQDVGSWTFTSRAPLPGEPTNLRVTATTASEIDLAWSGNSYNETAFRVERSTDLVNFTTTGMTTTTTFADKGLAHGTYYYRVVAVNAAGSSEPSNVVGATVPPSDPPPVITGVTRSNFAVKPNGTFTLNVDFTDPDPNDPHTAVITWGICRPPRCFPWRGASSTFRPAMRTWAPCPARTLPFTSRSRTMTAAAMRSTSPPPRPRSCRRPVWLTGTPATAIPPRRRPTLPGPIREPWSAG